MEKIFHKIAKKNMVNWDLPGFKKRYRKLYDSIIESMHAVEDKYTNKVDGDNVDKIYAMYPSKCPIKGSSTGKTKRNKDQIKRLLKKEYTFKGLTVIIRAYLVDCMKNEIYVKNFGTFLNNIPDKECLAPKNVFKQISPLEKYTTPKEREELTNNELDKLVFERKKLDGLQRGNKKLN